MLAVWALGCSPSERAPIGPGGRAAVEGELKSRSQDATELAPIKILDPLDGAVFPPEMAAPTFRWKDDNPHCDAWRIEFRFQDGQRMDFRSGLQEWTPSVEPWETIKRRSREREAVVTVLGASRGKVLSKASISIRTSKDEVGAPIFYREVNLPFRDAVRDPSRIRWRFGEIAASEQPPVVLEKLPVCGNCHSFSADGKVLGMDVDYANDRGSYAIVNVAREMILDKEHVITWSDYRKEDGQLTFGLLSQASPDGRYVASTVKDRSVFVATDDLAFSQLFFPIKGILVIYDRQSKEFHALPGADNARLVQSNPTWSPDGKYLVFARTESYRLKNLSKEGNVLLTTTECQEFLQGGKTFLFDLYRIPFNGGKGGTPEPLEGASRNGASNFFPKFSPDGKWIVFCKARSFMLLQPDSELYLVPAQGGRARRLRCNTSRMNSWHSWSPNGKWLVFSSKAFSPYTQLFLTHIDEQGESSIPVVLSRFSAPDRAANIPEFVSVKPGAIRKIAHAFLDDNSYLRAAFALLHYGRDPASTASLLRRSLEMNPKNTKAHLEMATLLTDQGKFEEAKDHLASILKLAPNDIEARHSLAVVLAKEGKLDEAVDQCRRALEASPNSPAAHLNLGHILLETGKLEQSVEHLAEALRLRPTEPIANYYWGQMLHRRGRRKEAATYYRRAIEFDSECVPPMLGLVALCITDGRATSAETKEALALARKACDLTGRKALEPLRVLAGMYAVAGEPGEAASTARTALDVARAAGDQNSGRQIRRMLDFYEKLQAENRRPSGLKPRGKDQVSETPDLPGLPDLSDLPAMPEGAAAKKKPETPATKTEAPARKPDTQAKKNEVPSDKR